MKSFDPQVGARELAPNSHRVELTGKLRSLTFPDACPNCGAAARERLRVRKVFRRKSYRRPWRYFIAEVRVPFCSACIARHESEVERMSTPRRLLTALLSVEALGALFCGGFALFVALKILAPMGQGEPLFAPVLGGVLFFAVIALIQARLAWTRTERFAIPPQTSVTRAFDFSDDVSDALDAEQRRVYAIRNPAFAEAFAALNRGRVWIPDAKAERSERRLTIALAVFLALAVLAGLVLNARGP